MSRTGPEREKPRLPPGIVRGIDLFNAGEYFEAHEVMEDVWKQETGTIRTLWQGLIQAAVACHHIRAGNSAGARKMIAAATDKLESSSEGATGLDLEALVRSLRRLDDAVLRGVRPFDDGRPVMRLRADG
ncbi:MAG: DUF309 domain-containing protein [Acidobacteriota bacterium]|nr:DUF309 domain-containing protein [Acidobacteriota bacterium]